MINSYEECKKLKKILIISTVSIIISVATIIYQQKIIEKLQEELLNKKIDIVNLKEIIDKNGG